jgi:DICT domain-containing protein
MPLTLSKVGMYAVSRAIEDDVVARADRPILIGAFQRAAFWRASQPRWRDLARSATLAVVLADLPRRAMRNGVHEVPLDDSDALHREWAVVCDAPGATACLIGSERPGQHRVRDLARRFDALWTVDPDIVREVARAGIAIAARRAPELTDLAAPRLSERAVVTPSSLVAATNLTNRIVAYLERLNRR